MRRALVVGSGPRVWQEVEEAKQLCPWDAFYVTNHAGVYWPDGRFVWVTLHVGRVADWKRERHQRGLHSDYEIVLPQEVIRPKAMSHRCVAYQWSLDNRRFTPSGSSGLFAVKVALEDGADRIVLAGVPMSLEPHFNSDIPWRASFVFRDGWIAAAQFYSRRTRSISGGWTQQMLGRPTQDWLDGEDGEEIQFPTSIKKPFPPLSQHGDWSRSRTQSWHRRAAQRRRDSSRLRIGDGGAERR